MDKRILTKAKEIIDDGMEFLEKNDIEGFYKFARQRLLLYDLAQDVIGGVTYILDQCGVPIFKECVKMGYIPYALCYGIEPPKEFFDNGVLALPMHINKIEGFAFSNAKKVNRVELRYAKEIYYSAFEACGIQKLSLGEDTLKYIVEGGRQRVDSIFAYNDIYDLTIPRKYFLDNDFVQQLFSLFSDSEFEIVTADFGIGVNP